MSDVLYVQEFLNIYRDRLLENGYMLDELVSRSGYIEAIFFKAGVGQVSYAFTPGKLPEDFTFAEFLTNLNRLLEYRYARSNRE